MASSEAESPHLVTILLEIDEQTRSGLLRFQSGDARRQLAIRSGRLAYAESSLADEHLARILLALGHIARPDLAEITKRMREGMPSDAAALSLGKLTDSDVAAALREQALAIGTTLLKGPTAPPRFYPDAVPPRAANIGIPLADFALECARRAARGARTAIPNDSIVVPGAAPPSASGSSRPRRHCGSAPSSG